jgi:hypothetical protein
MFQYYFMSCAETLSARAETMFTAPPKVSVTSQPQRQIFSKAEYKIIILAAFICMGMKL